MNQNKWPNNSGVVQFRIARPTNKLSEIKNFYDGWRIVLMNTEGI